MKLEVPEDQQQITINVNSDEPQQSTTKQATGITQILLIGIIVLVLNPNLATSLLAGLQPPTPLPNRSTDSTSTTLLASNQPKDYPRFKRILDNLILPIEKGPEEGCSDHPDDKGGKTYMGITYKTASRAPWNWEGDVCELPLDLLYRIYYHDYWNASGAIDQDSEAVAVALFNIAVHSGPGKAKQFLNKAPNHLKGKQLALWITAKQRQNYADIIARDPTQKQKVFQRGWNNRDNKVTKYIKNLP